MYTAILPDFQKQGEKFQEMAKAYPPELMKAFGVENAALIFSSLEAFLAMEEYSIIWPIMVVILLCAWAGSAISGEIEKGTMELLLAQPISRLRIFVEKYFAGLVMLFLFVVIGNFSVIPMANYFNIGYQLENLVKVSVIGFLFAWAIYALGMFFSALFSDKGKVYAATSGIFVIMYIIKIIASLKDSLSNLKYLSFFHYFDANSALVKNQINPENYWVFIGVILIFTVLGAIIFHKRDVAV